MAERAGNNFVPSEKIIDFVNRIEFVGEEMDSAKGTYMQECKERREDIRSIIKEAKDAGIPAQSLKAVIKARELERKAKAARDDLGDLDHQEKYDLIRHALGDFADLPLGKAALGRIGNGAQPVV